MSEPQTNTRRWWRVEYDRLIELGFFRPGDPIPSSCWAATSSSPSRRAAATSPPSGPRRKRCGPRSGAAGKSAAGGPLALDEDSEPEPDLAVVPGSFRDYQTGHPSRPVLVVEVSESSLALDREHKGSLYARAALADYWIVNLPERALEIYRDPEPDPAAPFGWRYRSVTVLGRGASVSPLARPGRRIQVVDLLL